MSDIEERNVWGAEINGRGFTVRIKVEGVESQIHPKFFRYEIFVHIP